MLKFEESNLLIEDFFKNKPQIRSQIFYEKDTIKNLLLDNQTIEVKKILSDKEEQKIYLVQLNGIFEKAPKFIIIENPLKFFIVLGTEKRRIWDYFINKITKEFPRQIGFSFLTSYEIREILEQSQKQSDTKFYYNRFVAKGVFGKNIDFTDVYYEKLKEKPFSEAFSKAKNKKGWVRMIEIYGEKKSFSFIINYRGQITLSHGTLSFLFSNLLNKEIEIFNEKNKFYEKRDRINTNNNPKKIIIEFEGEVFDDKKKILQFLKKIEKYPSCNYTVVEGGNPFLYVNILDRRDMSAFSIRTYKDNSLLLLPKIKTSAYSLQRFSKYLIEKFMEGKIYEFRQ